MVKYLSVFLLVLVLCIGITYSAFKDLGVGTRPMGMGGAFVALANDSNSLLWNSAGVSQVDRIEANMMYEKRFWGLEGVGIDQGFLGLVYPTPNIPKVGQLGSVGVGVQYLSADQKYIESVIGFTYALSLTGFGQTVPILQKIPLRIGFTLKMLYHKYVPSDESRGYIEQDPVFNYGSKLDQTGFTGDVGIHYTLDKKAVEALGDHEVLFGVSAENIIPADVSLSQTTKDEINKKWKEKGNTDDIYNAKDPRFADIVPMNFRIGFGHRMKALAIMNDFTNCVEVTYRSDFQKGWDETAQTYTKAYDFIRSANNITFRYGFETWFFKKMIGARLGALMGLNSSGTEIKTPVYVNATAGWTYILYGPLMEGKTESFSDVMIDYAVVFPVYGSLQLGSNYGTHKVSVLAKFGESVDAATKEAIIKAAKAKFDEGNKEYQKDNFALARDMFKEAYDLVQQAEYKQRYEEAKSRVDKMIDPILKGAKDLLKQAESIEAKTTDLSRADEKDAVDAGTKYKDALAKFKSAVAIDAKNVEAGDGVKKCDNKVLAMEKRVGEIKDYKEKDVKVKTMVAEAKNFAREKNWVKAYEKLNDALKLIPNHPEAANEMKTVKAEFDKLINDAMASGQKLFKEAVAEKDAKVKDEKLTQAGAEFGKVIETDNPKKKEAEDWIKKIKEERSKIK